MHNWCATLLVSSSSSRKKLLSAELPSEVTSCWKHDVTRLRASWARSHSFCCRCQTTSSSTERCQWLMLSSPCHHSLAGKDREERWGRECFFGLFVLFFLHNIMSQREVIYLENQKVAHTNPGTGHRQGCPEPTPHCSPGALKCCPCLVWVHYWCVTEVLNAEVKFTTTN